MTDVTNRAVCVIFSKDRPLQLDACLSSMEMWVDDFDRTDVSVLFAATSPTFSSQYRQVGLDHPGVDVRREVSFKLDLIDIVAGHEFILFVVDDTIFLGKSSLAAGISILESDARCLGLSYRLGGNTTYCYSMDGPQALPEFEVAPSGLLVYEWPDREFDFGYSVEVSSSLYRTKDLRPLLEALPYKNPNTLESLLAARASDFRATRPRLACYPQSVAVSIPANLVQSAWANRSVGQAELSAASLSVAFGQGRRLDVASYGGHVPQAAHEELPFRFLQRSDLPAVSVVIPCYEQAEFLAEALASVVDQTFADWEIVVVDDGSPDATSEVAEQFARSHPDRRIRTIRQANAGLARARNAGIEQARGQFTLPLDADDRLAPTAMERMLRVLTDHPDVAIAYTDVRRFGEDDRLIQAGEWDPVVLPIRNFLSYCSLYRRELWDAVGGYNPNMIHGYEDWDFWLGAAERGYAGRRVAEPLFEYRVRTKSMFAGATAHDSELRRQIVANHPGLYSVNRRLRRWLRLEARWLRSLVRVGRYSPGRTG